MDLQENMRAANQRTLEWVTSMHQSILDATKTYVASFAKSAPEPQTLPGPTRQRARSQAAHRGLLRASRSRMLEENKNFSLALADAWAAAGPSKNADQQPEQ